MLPVAGEKDIDKNTSSQLLPGAPKDLLPKKVYSDGNCLFPAMSISVHRAADKVYHLCLQLCTACELIMHSKQYAEVLPEWESREGGGARNRLACKFSDDRCQWHSGIHMHHLLC